MRRFWSTVLRDIRFQFRNGFYYASLVVIIMWIVGLRLLPESTLIYSLPVALLNNLTITAYFFVAALILFEKGEGTLQALAMTPLSHAEVIVSRIITLVMLGWLEGLIILVFLVGFDFNLLWYTLSIFIAGFQYVLLGIILVARYDSINTFIIPGGVFIAPLSLPMLPYYGIWESPLWLLHPMGATMYLLKAAFGLTVGPIELLLSLISAMVWCWLLLKWAISVYQHMILRGGSA